METQIPGIGDLVGVLDTAALRHRVVAQNVANVNTPGYRRLEVVTDSGFARALASAGSPAPPGRPRVVASDEGPERVDGNNVDIDKEMSALGKNALLYAAASQIIAAQVAAYRSAIAGR